MSERCSDHAGALMACRFLGKVRRGDLWYCGHHDPERHRDPRAPRDTVKRRRERALRAAHDAVLLAECERRGWTVTLPGAAAGRAP